jgi:drug/metabolite transporter (DMT)-like permease
MKVNSFRVYGAVVLSMVFWSFSFIWFKMANEYYRPVTVVFMRLVIAIVILSLYLKFTKKFVKIRKEDRNLFLLLAFFEPFIYFLGESHGLTYVTPTTGSVIISTIPVVAAIGAWFFFGERLKLVNYAGILLSFIGILVFVIKSDGSLSFNIKGLLLLGVAVVSAVGYNLTLSRLVESYSPVYIVNVQNVLGGIMFLPVFMIFEFRHFTGVEHSFSSLWPIVALSVFASCGAFILFAFGVRYIGISKANVFTNCIPIFTAVFSFFLVSEKLTFQSIAGMVIVTAGLFLSQAKGRKKELDDALLLTGKTA